MSRSTAFESDLTNAVQLFSDIYSLKGWATARQSKAPNPGSPGQINIGAIRAGRCAGSRITQLKPRIRWHVRF